MPDLSGFELRALADDAAAQFIPHFDRVRTRARRLRRVRAVMVTALTVGLLAAGGGAAATWRYGAAAPPAAPAGTPAPGPWSVDWSDSPRSPQPQPSYVEITPGFYDVEEADKPLTGIFTELRAGDLKHLYLEYRDCEADHCVGMLATSGDGGHNWQRRSMPEGLVLDKRYSNLVAVRGTTVLAADAVSDTDNPTDEELSRRMEQRRYWVSTDAGRTWRQPAAHTVDAVPQGWAPFESYSALKHPALTAFDPATGDVVSVPAPDAIGFDSFPVTTPDATGIWLLTASRLMISRDGGRTWQQRLVPSEVVRGGYTRGQIVTNDGRSVYAYQKLAPGRVRIFTSTDGAANWKAGAELDLDGPLLSPLPTGGDTVLIESNHGIWRSTDHGATFAKVGPSLGARGYAPPDGSTWHYVGRPDVP